MLLVVRLVLVPLGFLNARGWKPMLTFAAVVNFLPMLNITNASATLEHEATTTRLSEEQLFYVMQRGLSQEDAVALLVNGFVREVLQELPMEFAVEAQKLVAISLEGSVG